MRRNRRTICVCADVGLYLNICVSVYVYVYALVKGGQKRKKGVDDGRDKSKFTNYCEVVVLILLAHSAKIDHS